MTRFQGTKSRLEDGHTVDHLFLSPSSLEVIPEVGRLGAPVLRAR